MKNELFNILKKYEKDLDSPYPLKIEFHDKVIIIKKECKNPCDSFCHEEYAFLLSGSSSKSLDFKHYLQVMFYSDFLIAWNGVSRDVVFNSGKVISCKEVYFLNNGDILLELQGKMNEHIYAHYSTKGEQLFEIRYMLETSFMPNFYAEMEKELAEFEKHGVFYKPKGWSNKSIAFLTNNGVCLYDIEKRLWLVDPEGTDFRA